MSSSRPEKAASATVYPVAHPEDVESTHPGQPQIDLRRRVHLSDPTSTSPLERPSRYTIPNTAGNAWRGGRSHLIPPETEQANAPAPPPMSEPRRSGVIPTSVPHIRRTRMPGIRVKHLETPPYEGAAKLAHTPEWIRIREYGPNFAVNDTDSPKNRASCVILGPMSSQPRSRPAALGTEIAAKLREALARRQVTQAELGKRVSISTSQISLYLRGKRAMSLDEFHSICAALELSADEVFSQAFLLTSGRQPS